MDDVAADLEKALWEDLVTEDDVDDSGMAEQSGKMQGYRKDAGLLRIPCAIFVIR